MKPKTVTIPTKLAERILDDIENILRQHTGQNYGLRGFTLASIDALADAAGWETPCRQLNKMIAKNRAKLRKAYAGSGMTDAQAALDALRYMHEQKESKPRKRKAAR